MSLHNRDVSCPPGGNHEASRLTNRLGNSEPFLPEDPTLDEHAQLGMGPGEVSMREHRGEENPAKTLVTPHPIERNQGLPLREARQ
jgi:hypothetical protein